MQFLLFRFLNIIYLQETSSCSAISFWKNSKKSARMTLINSSISSVELRESKVFSFWFVIFGDYNRSKKSFQELQSFVTKLLENLKKKNDLQIRPFCPKFIIMLIRLQTYNAIDLKLVRLGLWNYNCNPALIFLAKNFF